MFKRSRRPWRGNVHRWVRKEQVDEPQQFQPDQFQSDQLEPDQFQPDQTNNPGMPPHQDYNHTNFKRGRGGLKRDFHPHNSPDSVESHLNFGKKPKNLFNKSDNFNSHRGNVNRNHRHQPSDNSFHGGPPQNMHHNRPHPPFSNQPPSQNPPNYRNKPPQNQSSDSFPPPQMSMDSVPFRCTMCGKPFKKEVLLDIHLKTECKARKSQGPLNQAPYFPPENYRGENKFRSSRGGQRRLGGGRRGDFNPNFHAPQEGGGFDPNVYPPQDGGGFEPNFHPPQSDSKTNAENAESWNNFDNDRRYTHSFSRSGFLQQKAFRANRGRGRGFHHRPYRGGPMGPRPPYNPDFEDNSQHLPNNNFDSESYHPNQPCEENSNNYEGPVEDQFNFPNNHPPNVNHRQDFSQVITCNLCNLQCNTFEEVLFHKEKFHLKCKFCIAFFATMTDLYMHQETHLTGDDGHEEDHENIHDDPAQLPCPPLFPPMENLEGQCGGLNEPEMGEIATIESIPEVILHSCCLCCTSFGSILELAEHTSALHLPATVCSECGCLFKDEEQLQGHIKYEHGTNDFPEKERLAILAHTDYYPCEMCSEIQCNPVALEYHMHFHRVHRVQHESKGNRQPYIACPECNVLIKSTGLKNHILNNHKLVTCNVCQQVFSDKYIYVKHVDLEHYPNCVCNICCAICFNNNALQQHGATEHAMGDLYKCELCSKRFGMSTLLNMHELVHQELFNQCKVCGEFFKVPNRLLEFRSHMIEVHGMDSSMFV